MSGNYTHYVCTRDEARRILDAHDRIWVSHCGCREGNPSGCARSRPDVCLSFRGENASGGGGLREITRAEAEAILREAESRRLVTRPFRDESRERTVGICICCDDCCAYFQPGSDEPCDPGALLAYTDPSLCSGCGDCTPVCYFGARRIEGGALVVDESACYGCGLCVDACPTQAIEMVQRNGQTA